MRNCFLSYEIIFHVPLQSHKSIVIPQDSFTSTINIVFHLSHPWWLCSICGVLIDDPCKFIPRANEAHCLHVSSIRWQCLFNFKMWTQLTREVAACYTILYICSFVCTVYCRVHTHWKVLKMKDIKYVTHKVSAASLVASFSPPWLFWLTLSECWLVHLSHPALMPA